jgi:peptidyl-prolyl cis-trans isomerase D
MLEGIRKKTKSVYILLIFGAIIVVFIFWGGDTGGDKSAGGSVVAIVNNETIAYKDYIDIYKRQVEYYRNTLKDEFTDEMASGLNLRGTALNIIINRVLAIQDAELRGIRASDEEVQAYISGMPAFLVDGRFNQEQYFKILNANRIDPAVFERSIAYDMVAEKMRDSIVSGITVTDMEVRDAYFKGNRRIELEYITVDSASFEDKVEVTDDEGREYLAKNSSEFFVPLKIKASYAHAEFAGFEARAKVSEEEILEYYKANPVQFERPAEVSAAHILIRPDYKVTDKAKADSAAKSKAEGILKKIKGGEKFEALALKFSDDPGSASAGGDLGWFKRGVMLKRFEEAAFSLNPGEVSGVVRTEFGYHIIKMAKRREAGLVPLKKVRGSIKARLKAESGRAQAETVISGFQGPFIGAQSEQDLKKIVGDIPGVTLTTTPEFYEDDKEEFLAVTPRLRDIIFTMDEGDVTRPVEVDGGFYIVKIVRRINPHVPEFSLVSAEVSRRVKLLKSMAMAGKEADTFLKNIKGGEGLKPLAKAGGLRVRSTGLFSMAEGVIPNIGMYIGDNQAISALSESEPYYPEVVAIDAKFYVLKLKRSREAPEAGLEAVRAEWRSRLQTMKKEAAIDEWVAGVREKADIQVFEELL